MAPEITKMLPKCIRNLLLFLTLVFTPNSPICESIFESFFITFRSVDCTSTETIKTHNSLRIPLNSRGGPTPKVQKFQYISSRFAIPPSARFLWSKKQQKGSQHGSKSDQNTLRTALRNEFKKKIDFGTISDVLSGTEILPKLAKMRGTDWYYWLFGQTRPQNIPKPSKGRPKTAFLLNYI